MLMGETNTNTLVFFHLRMRGKANSLVFYVTSNKRESERDREGEKEAERERETEHSFLFALSSSLNKTNDINFVSHLTQLNDEATLNLFCTVDLVGIAPCAPEQNSTPSIPCRRSAKYLAVHELFPA